MSFTTNKPVLCLGDTYIDVLIPFGELRTAAKNGEDTTPLSQPTHTLGGTIPNAARVFTSLGLQVFAATTIDNGRYGDYIITEFQKYGIRADYVFRQAEPMTLILAVIDESGERTLFHYCGPDARLPSIIDEIVEKVIPHLEDFGWLYFCGCSPGNTIAVAEAAKEKGVLVALDLNLRIHRFGMNQERKELILRMIESADVILGSGSKEFIPLTGLQDSDAAVKSLLEDNKVFVVRDGAEPVKIYRNDKIITVAPPQVNVINTIGAGDSFSAAFVSALENGCSLTEAAEWGNNMAGWLISTSDRSVLPDKKKLLELVRQNTSKNSGAGKMMLTGTETA